MNFAHQLFTSITLIIAAMTPQITLAYFPMRSEFPMNPIDPSEVESPGSEYSHMAHLHSGGLHGIHPGIFHGDSAYNSDFTPYQTDSGDPVVLDGINPMQFQHNPITMGAMRPEHMNYPRYLNPLGDKIHSVMNLPRNPMTMMGMPNQMSMGGPSLPTAGMYQQPAFANIRRRPKKQEVMKRILGNKAAGTRSTNSQLTRMSSTIQDIGKLMGKNDKSWMAAVRSYFRKMLARKKQQQILQQQQLLKQQQQIRQQQSGQQMRRVLLNQ